MQNILSSEQLKAFYHDAFCSDQLSHFKELVLFNDSIKLNTTDVIMDLGGGVGFFARAISDICNYKVRVIDTDKMSVNECIKKNIQADVQDVTQYKPQDDESIACANLILHHLVGKTSYLTYMLQMKTLRNWNDRYVFVHEYIYESMLPKFSGWIIYKITASKLFSAMAATIAKLIPALRANTFGIGVRFRSNNEWEKLFNEAGFKVTMKKSSKEDNVALALRFLLIKKIVRMSYLLEPDSSKCTGDAVHLPSTLF